MRRDILWYYATLSGKSVLRSIYRSNVELRSVDDYSNHPKPWEIHPQIHRKRENLLRELSYAQYKSRKLDQFWRLISGVDDLLDAPGIPESFSKYAKRARVLLLFPSIAAFIDKKLNDFYVASLELEIESLYMATDEGGSWSIAPDVQSDVDGTLRDINRTHEEIGKHMEQVDRFHREVGPGFKESIHDHDRELRDGTYRDKPSLGESSEYSGYA